MEPLRRRDAWTPASAGVTVKVFPILTLETDTLLTAQPRSSSPRIEVQCP